jgi:oxygen-independent coproporphyrinogen-3 oxidase
VGKALSTPPAEYTVEANPESLTPRFLETCAEAGVNRLSLGIQTFSEEARRSAGRFCPQPDITHALAVVRDTWRGRLNLDLIAGFPAQRQGDVRRDVEVAAEIRPDHVSLYALTHEGETLTADREDRVDELWIEGVQRLEDLGYANYEICNFARPGQECLHNLVYWRLDPYLGIGPSAVSTLPDGQGGARRLQNPASLDEYLAMEPDASGGQGQALPPEDLLFEILIMGLRLRVGIEIDTFERRLGRRPPDLLPRTLAGWSARSLLAPLPGRLALRPEGRIVLDALLVEARQEIDTVPRGAIRLSWP